MKTLFPFTLLLFALSALGQPTPINRHAMLISGLATGGGNPYSPLNTNNIAFWWAADDITVGTNNAVTNWVDRIQHYAWLTNGTVSQSPTWDGSGVVFAAASSQRLMSNGATIAWFGPTAQLLIVVNHSASSGNRTYTSWGVNRSLVAVAGQWKLGDTSPLVANNHTYDLLYTAFNGSNYKSYTNGILYMTSTGPLSSMGSDRPMLGCFNNGGSPTEFISATIRELIVWTNNNAFTNASGPITISNVHYYVTNKYHDITP